MERVIRTLGRLLRRGTMVFLTMVDGRDANPVDGPPRSLYEPRARGEDYRP